VHQGAGNLTQSTRQPAGNLARQGALTESSRQGLGQFVDSARQGAPGPQGEQRLLSERWAAWTLFLLSSECLGICCVGGGWFVDKIFYFSRGYSPSSLYQFLMHIRLICSALPIQIPKQILRRMKFEIQMYIVIKSSMSTPRRPAPRRSPRSTKSVVSSLPPPPPGMLP
jgi:hypothetical protein